MDAAYAQGTKVLTFRVPNKEGFTVVALLNVSFHNLALELNFMCV